MKEWSEFGALAPIFGATIERLGALKKLVEVVK
jgi:hypothetical protein